MSLETPKPGSIPDDLTLETLDHSSGNPPKTPIVEVRWQNLKELGPDDEEGLGKTPVNPEIFKAE